MCTYVAGFDDVSLRPIVHTTIGGNGVRIRLANTFGASGWPVASMRSSRCSTPESTGHE
jgi:hypothetical protein